MFHLDQCLPKDWLRSRWGGTFIWDLRWESARGGCDVTNGDIWWYLLDLAGKLATAWPRFRCKSRHHPSGSLRPREGTRADRWMGEDGHSSVSPEGRDIYINDTVHTRKSFVAVTVTPCEWLFMEGAQIETLQQGLYLTICFHVFVYHKSIRLKEGALQI